MKIFGERNTGTIYFAALFAKNIEAALVPGIVPNKWYYRYQEFSKNLYFRLSFRKTLGWKHSLVKVQQLRRYGDIEDTCFITLTKNPYSFLLSLYKRPYHLKGTRPRSLEEFLASRWYLQRRDNMNVPYLGSPVQLWNQKNAAYLKLKEAFPESTMNLRYEDLLANPKGTLASVARRFGLRRRGDFQNILRSTKDDGKSFEDFQSYYLNKEWRSELDSGSVEIINSRLDTGLAERYAYRVLSSKEVGASQRDASRNSTRRMSR